MTDRQQVRLLISDVGGESGTDFLFSDDEVDAFLEMEPVVYRAAAVALRTIAGNEAQVSKRISYLGLSTDGPAVAKELRELAASLDERADKSDDGSGGFDIAEMPVDPGAVRTIRGRDL